ncbi:hypothetical protein WMY93_028982 [Mugilogobius chulae]|uniref:TRAF-type domain-containing protein n=1 Tax=Mugilogobius chulae TaxID=88201 RepID=A0AAW0MWL4_9GOBI
MADEEETRVCGRCKKAVAEANFALHESHCSRFLRLCQDCNENVPVSEMEQHRQEQHTQVKCPKCRKKMERRLLPEHQEEECPERVQPCVFCELEMTWTQLQQHALACGSRTERCPDCDRYIKLSDREEHSRACPGQDLYSEPSEDNEAPKLPPKIPPRAAARGAQGAGKTKIQCKVCMLTFPADEIKKHEMMCDADPEWKYDDSDSDSDSDFTFQASGVEYVSSRVRNMDLPQTFGADWTRGGSSSETKDPNELSTCPHCQLVLPWVTLRWHVRSPYAANNAATLPWNSQRKKAVAEANFALHESHCSRFLRLCQDCNENVPVSEMEQHRQEQHTQVKCPKCRKKMERRLLPEHQEEECPERVQPCVFCELEMTWTQLQQHALACGSRTERCPDCDRYIKLSDREEHSRACPGQDLYRKTKIQCKVCMLTFPADEIKKHEMMCDADPEWKYDDSDSDSDSDFTFQASGVEYVSSRVRNMDLPQTFGADWTRGGSSSETKDPNELSTCPHCQLVLPWVTLRWHVTSVSCTYISNTERPLCR